jgi:hypothetical protein
MLTFIDDYYFTYEIFVSFTIMTHTSININVTQTCHFYHALNFLCKIKIISSVSLYDDKSAAYKGVMLNASPAFASFGHWLPCQNLCKDPANGWIRKLINYSESLNQLQ